VSTPEPTLADRDLLLSSGFLAFARHAGVVQALNDRGLRPAAWVGTSSGAVVAALCCAGLTPAQLLDEIDGVRPWRLMRLHGRPWRGLFEAVGLRALLERHLPARFEDLPQPLAVGVVGSGRAYRLLSAGPLVPAVLASCAMPAIFAPVEVEGERLADGGAADRVGLAAWRLWRPGRRAWVHQVARTAGKDVGGDRSGTVWIQTPRSGASFWRLGDVRAQAAEAHRRAIEALADEAR
jgi:predicted acylesterase/phospholipase RssA